MRSRVSRSTAVLLLLRAAVLFLTLFPKEAGRAGMEAALLYFRLEERESPSGELWVASLSGRTWRLADGVRAGEPDGTDLRSEEFYYAYAFWLHPGGLIRSLDRYFSAALYDRTAKRLVERAIHTRSTPAPW